MAPSFEIQIGNNGGHDKFRQLCALYSSGSLTKPELRQLNEHLPTCPECRDLLREYSVIVQTAIPVLGEELDISEVAGFNRELEEGKARILAVLGGENGAGSKRAKRADSVAKYLKLHSPSPASATFLYGTALLLILCAAIGGYFLGIHRPHQAAEAEIKKTLDRPDDAQTAAATARVLAQRDEEIKKLSLEISRLEHDLSAFKNQVANYDRVRSQEASRVSTLSDENTGLRADREQVAQRLNDAQTGLAQLKREVEQLQSERESALVRSMDSDKRIEAFKAQMHSQGETISEQERLLAADRDIRELMGARDLLLADVFDIDQNGKNKKPFGRIFYTKNRSLIFYAFDLDRQPELRDARAFQVWGARAADNGKASAFNMGIFYMDNEAMRRWVLKFDDPKVLAQIDSVFVTIEPQGGSNKPSGKQLLFASLRGEPNHP